MPVEDDRNRALTDHAVGGPASVPPKAPAWAFWAVLAALLGMWGWCVAGGAVSLGRADATSSSNLSGFGDFQHFYNAGLATRLGDNIYARLADQPVPPYAPGGGGYIYPPLLAAALAPLSLLSPNAAGAIWVVLNGLLWLGVLAAASRVFNARLGLPTDRMALVLSCAITHLLLIDKVKSEFQLGQTDVLLYAALLGAMVALGRRAWLCGVLLALAISIKYVALIFVPYLIVRRRWRELAWLAGSLVALNLTPAAVYGWDRNLEYLSIAFAGLARMVGLAPAADAANIHALTWGRSVSLMSVFGRLAERVAGTGEPSKLITLGGTAAVGALALAFAWWCYARAGLGLWTQRLRGLAIGGVMQARLAAIEWPLLVAASLVFSPQTTSRHLFLLVVLVMPAVALVAFQGYRVDRLRVPRWPIVVALVLLTLGLVLPPGGEQYAQALRWWRAVGGASWCTLGLVAAWLWSAPRLIIGDAAAPAGPKPDTLPESPARTGRTKRTTP